MIRLNVLISEDWSLADTRYQQFRP